MLNAKQKRALLRQQKLEADALASGVDLEKLERRRIANSVRLAAVKELKKRLQARVIRVGKDGTAMRKVNKHMRFGFTHTHTPKHAPWSTCA